MIFRTGFYEGFSDLLGFVLRFSSVPFLRKSSIYKYIFFFKGVSKSLFVGCPNRSLLPLPGSWPAGRTC